MNTKPTQTTVAEHLHALKVAEYLHALKVLEFARADVINQAIKQVGIEAVDHVANALAGLSHAVSTDLRARANAERKAGDLSSAFISTMLAYSVEEYSSAVEQAHEISGSFVQSADEVDEMETELTAENFDRIVNGNVENSH